MKITNLTPHVVRLNDGRTIPPSGQVARVSCTYVQDVVPGLYKAVWGDVVGLPAPDKCPICGHVGWTVDGGGIYYCAACHHDIPTPTLYIVSGLVAQAVKGRPDVVSPATGHPDCVRKDGQVWSVPGFVVSG